MLTTSSATAPGRDCVPFNKSNLKNWMCLFVVTRKDGTLFDATSVTEVDIVKICINLGHNHALGALCHSTMELVALFSSTEDMQCTTHGAIMATELWDEAIAIRAAAPSETHIKAYIIAVRGTLQNSNLHPHRGRENPTHPLIILTQVGKLHVISKQSLATSLTMNCVSS